MSDAIVVLIADDHAIVRQGLTTFLELQEGIEVGGEAADGERAVALAERIKPDVVLMDLVMPVLDGIEAIARIHESSPSTRIIVLTSFADDERIFAAIRVGAAGYLMKDVSPQELARAIRMVHAGEPILAPGVMRRLMDEVGRPSEEAGDHLTEREIEVLKLIAQGRSNKEIARDLSLSEKTVKTHVSNILQKLRLADRTQAALYAVRRRLVEP
ncbi:MAG: response regulator transcription factor [Dehalococcoidia bacterium]